MALRAEDSEQPALAAISPTVIVQTPWSRTASATTRSVLSSATVKQAASRGGKPPL